MSQYYGIERTKALIKDRKDHIPVTFYVHSLVSTRLSSYMRHMLELFSGRRRSKVLCKNYTYAFHGNQSRILERPAGIDPIVDTCSQKNHFFFGVGGWGIPEFGSPSDLTSCRNFYSARIQACSFTRSIKALVDNLLMFLFRFLIYLMMVNALFP